MADLEIISRWIVKGVPAAATLVGAVIAYLVYRLNADRFYLDTFDKRREALTAVFEAASDRQREAVMLRAEGGELPDQPAQRAFWLAKDRASSLFDRPVKRALHHLDETLRDFAMLRALMTEARDYGERMADAGRQHSEAVTAIEEARKKLANECAPFVNLGSKGLRPLAALTRRFRK